MVANIPFQAQSKTPSGLVSAALVSHSIEGESKPDSNSDLETKSDLSSETIATPESAQPDNLVAPDIAQPEVPDSAPVLETSETIMASDPVLPEQTEVASFEQEETDPVATSDDLGLDLEKDLAAELEASLEGSLEESLDGSLEDSLDVDFDLTSELEAELAEEFMLAPEPPKVETAKAPDTASEPEPEPEPEPITEESNLDDLLKQLVGDDTAETPSSSDEEPKGDGGKSRISSLFGKGE